MQFLVRIDTARAYELPPDERAELIARERTRGRELMDHGVLRDIWRVPGRRANVGIWDVPDADALEQALESLPARPYAEIDVTPLATHPLTAEANPG
ncbi:muconolactone Delta-isomerase family protein [Prauserella cavernicola]|uniref:Muconolactone Delta-isomerase n=1 Tax=Prauserella cavernicola TaxID=2800127 RepID=A0A934QPT0_9PSEU|nr:muconolactone Delta-isomerase family protein [Prauserella cavernicola]MBK1783947.1 muconolactone Delta-isomerase family protein [Prauserella cavernicola]